MAATTETVTPYIATGTIKHSGKFYYQGDEIELTEADAEPLVRVGAVTAKPEAEAPEAPEGADDKGKKKSKTGAE